MALLRAEKKTILYCQVASLSLVLPNPPKISRSNYILRRCFNDLYGVSLLPAFKNFLSKQMTGILVNRAESQSAYIDFYDSFTHTQGSIVQ